MFERLIKIFNIEKSNWQAFFFLVLSWQTTTQKIKSKILHQTIQPSSCHWFLSIPPENIRKQEVFWCFRGYRKRPVAWKGLKAVFEKKKMQMTWFSKKNEKTENQAAKNSRASDWIISFFLILYMMIADHDI